MIRPKLTLLAALALSASVAAGCPGGANPGDDAGIGDGDGDGDGDTGDGDGDGDGDPASAPITSDDLVNLGDLLSQEQDAAAAAYAVGEPAQYLALAQENAEEVCAHVAAILDHLGTITESEPTNTGTTPDGKPFALYRKVGPNNTFSLLVVRTAENRLRYTLRGKPNDSVETRILLTGVFIKRAPQRGGGRFHLSLTALNQLGVGPGLNGSMHFYFANHKEDRRARRVVYRNVFDPNDNQLLPKNYAADLIRVVGEGGRYRSVILDDLIDTIPGRELFGFKVRWKTGVGGRAAAVLASYNAGDPVVLGAARECWDSDGNRVAYVDNIDGNEDVNPNEGDISDCFLIPEDEIPEDPAPPSTDGIDGDSEVDDLFADADVDDITEDEADASDDEM